MQKNTLGHTGIEVTDFCLGSMTWGTQNNPEEGHAQIERALDAGINFIDTADVYSSGEPETMVGKALPGRRHDVVLATKVRGRMGAGSVSSPMKIAASRPSKTISTAMPSSVFWVGEGAVPPGP